MARGRKPTKIDQGRFEGMVTFGATCLDCANEFNCTEESIVRYVKRTYGTNFVEFSNKKRGTVRMKLRHKQIQLALEGSVPLLIWCGKQYLGQSDKIEQSIDQAPTRLIIDRGNPKPTDE